MFFCLVIKYFGLKNVFPFREGAEKHIFVFSISSFSYLLNVATSFLCTVKMLKHHHILQLLRNKTLIYFNIFVRGNILA